MPESTETKVELLSQRLYALEKGQEANLHAHERIYGRLETAERSNSGTDIKLDSIVKALDDLKHDMKTIKEKPSKRMDIIVTAIITLLVGAIGTFLLNGILRR